MRHFGGRGLLAAARLARQHTLSKRACIVQVVEVCRAANPRLIIKRARFSALVHNDLTRAVQNLVPPDRLASEAVDARQEIDLRIGASFTRFQTLLLQVLKTADVEHIPSCIVPS